jgi:hypothetical protein
MALMHRAGGFQPTWLEFNSHRLTSREPAILAQVSRKLHVGSWRKTPSGHVTCKRVEHTYEPEWFQTCT